MLDWEPVLWDGGGVADGGGSGDDVGPWFGSETKEK